MVVRNIALVDSHMTGPKEIAWGWRLGGLLYTALPGCPPRLSPPEPPGPASSGAWRPALVKSPPQLHLLQVSVRSKYNLLAV